MKNLKKKIKNKKFINIFLITCFFSFICNAEETKTISGKAQVIDGDTIKIQDISVRLFGIDAPEKKQICTFESQPYKCGLESSQFLKKIIESSSYVDCSYRDFDRYKRIIGECVSHNKIVNKKTTESLNLNYLMVRNGHAIDYRRYSKGKFSLAESLAKKEKKGIWRGKFEKPENWRRKYK